MLTWWPHFSLLISIKNSGLVPFLSFFFFHTHIHIYNCTSTCCHALINTEMPKQMNIINYQEHLMLCSLTVVARISSAITFLLYIFFLSSFFFLTASCLNSLSDSFMQVPLYTYTRRQKKKRNKDHTRIPSNFFFFL